VVDIRFHIKISHFVYIGTRDVRFELHLRNANRLGLWYGRVSLFYFNCMPTVFYTTGLSCDGAQF